jgi:beta-lactam-binding protein with PASTA domain
MAIKNRKRFVQILITVLAIWLVAIPVTLLAIGGIALRPARQAKVVVPQIVGLPRKDADQKLRNSNLAMQVMLTRWDQPDPAGTVLFQVPGAGETVDPGMIISVSVAGPPPDPSFLEEKPRKDEQTGKSHGASVPWEKAVP